MTRLQAVILIAVFALAGCIDDGLDDTGYEDHPDCTTDMSWSYCDSTRVDIGWDGHSEPVVTCGRDEVFITPNGAVWSRTCEFVCLDVCAE